MRHQRGFTLIELMVTVVIIGVLTAIALPAYQKSVQKGNRSGAEQLMLQIASAEAQWFQDARSYTNVVGTGGLNVTGSNGANGWDCTQSSNTSCNNTYYKITVAVTTPTNAPPYFVITATPQSKQVSDGTLYLNADHTGTYSQGTKARSTGDYSW